MRPATSSSAVGYGAAVGGGARRNDASDFPALMSPHQQPPHQAFYAQPQQHQQQQQQQQQQTERGVGAIAPPNLTNPLQPPPPPPGLDSHDAQQPNGTPRGGDSDADFPALGGQGGGVIGAGVGAVGGARTMGGSGVGIKGTIRTVNGSRTGQQQEGMTMGTGTIPPPPPGVSGNALHSQTVPPPPPAATTGVAATGTTGTATTTTTTTTSNPGPTPPGIPLVKPVHQIVSSPVDKWGLEALLTLIKSGGKDDQLGLQLGDDLMGIGLDMQAPNPLYPTFTSPWQEPDSARNLVVEEDYKIPACYNVQTPAASTKIGQFSDETLFYAFYTCPQDVLQMEVAAELYMRNWRWHKELSVWLTRDPNEQTEQGPGYERGVFYYFDPNRYEKAETPKDFVCHYDRLEDRPEWLNRQGAAQGPGQQQSQQPQQQQQQQQQQQGGAGQTRGGVGAVQSLQQLQGQVSASSSQQNQNQQQPVAQTS